jgi:hypothetical protein
MLGYRWLAVVVLAGATPFACSSGGGSGASSANACLAAERGQACAACAEASCGSQLASAESACAAYLDCLCPGGTFDAATASACTSTITPACNAAYTPFGDCLLQQCQSACSSNGSSSSSSGSTSTVPIACMTATSCSSQDIPPSDVMMVTSQCKAANGTVGSACSATGLVGCCKYGTAENCFYTAAAAASGESTCAMTGGVWSTSL